MNNKTKGIVSYIVLAFGLAWIMWEIAIQLGIGPGHTLFQLAVLPGAFASAEGFGDAGLRPNLRSRWPYYLVAWLLPLPVGT